MVDFGSPDAARGDRPDRRLAQRQARAAALRAVDRGRRRADDGRRRVRLRAATSGPSEEWVAWRGARRAARRRAARPDARRAPHARRQARGARASSRPTRAGSCSPPTRWPRRRTGCARSARSPSRSARSRRRASTRWPRLKRCRAVDAAAAQLIVREAGGHVAFIAYEDPLAAPLDLEPHSPVIAAARPRPAWPRSARSRSGRSAGARACHPGSGDRLEARRAPSPAASRTCSPPAIRRPFQLLDGPAAESERLVSAYTGLAAERRARRRGRRPRRAGSTRT